MSNWISEIRLRSNVLVQTRRPQTELSSPGITISGRTSRARADHFREASHLHLSSRTMSKWTSGLRLERHSSRLRPNIAIQTAPESHKLRLRMPAEAGQLQNRYSSSDRTVTASGQTCRLLQTQTSKLRLNSFGSDIPAQIGKHQNLQPSADWTSQPQAGPFTRGIQAQT